mmetsp:Transcript_49328/g.86878  ORF Transcript_49328/g.86878 Transcript_49328/m.86878 type:complete len:414 (+) Transcript_49328:77-1318(+)
MACTKVSMILVAVASVTTASAQLSAPESCSSAMPAHGAPSLIQVRSGSEVWPLGDGQEDTTQPPPPSVVDESLAVQTVKKSAHVPKPPQGKIQEMTVKLLPAHLKQQGISTFGSESKLKKVLANTVVLNISYAGESMQLVFPRDDDSVDRWAQVLPEFNGQEYGLNTVVTPIDKDEMAFESRRLLFNSSKFINMIDLGGHVGAVSIAMWKKYPGLVRGVVVEPLDKIFFLLSLNLWLNEIPPLAVPEKNEDPQPGILAVNKALYGQPGQMNSTVQMCSPWGRLNKTSTMMSYVVSSSKAPCECNAKKGQKDICSNATSITLEKVFSFFPTEDISFLKMNCEGCEEDALLTLDSAAYRGRIRRLAAEMHAPRPLAAAIACSLPGKGAYLSGTCASALDAGFLQATQFCLRCMQH